MAKSMQDFCKVSRRVNRPETCEGLESENTQITLDDNQNREFFIQLIQSVYFIHYDKFYLTNVTKNLL